MRSAWIVFALVFGISPALAGGTDGKIVLENWDRAYLNDGKAGYVRTITRELNFDGMKVLHTTVEMRLTVKRFNDTLQMAMDTGSTETHDGAVLGVFMRQFLGKEQKLLVEGTVVGKQLRLVKDGKVPLLAAPWRADVIGYFKQQSIFKDRTLEPGTKFTYQSFEPSINLVLKTEVHVHGHREVILKGSKAKRKLLLVEVTPDRVEFKSGGKIERIQLPVSMTWLDEKFEPVKTEFEIPMLGPIVLVRSTKEQALAPGPIAQLTDLGMSQLVRLKSRIVDAHQTRSAVYRVTVRGDDNVATTFSNDNRQQVKNVRGNSFDLLVNANGKLPESAKAEKKPDAECSQSSYFINSKDSKVQALAREAVGAETDGWRKAIRIERWVHANMRFANHESLATADHVARTLEGDCTEYAMLAAAMCRAQGIPSRTAIGLVYAEVKRSPCFGFHMWTEVWIAGQWLAIDATIGKGGIGAAHLKITDHSWHETVTMTPIFPVIRVVGRVMIDVLSAESR
ncbi:MAG: transglutaminase domain-containing protein [Gemmataceae bacterium]|nr:transglutaminase domain-containing protein [Gemmataceae bacterium]